MSKNDFKILSDREHILHRPSMYIGSINFEEQSDFIIHDDKIEYSKFEIVPGLCKIINEVLDNSIDEAIKTNFKYANEISIEIGKDFVKVSDNGRGIPVVKHDEGYQPYLCWGRAKAGSNFNDDNHVQIGMNGLGSHLTCVYSKKFIGETDDGKQSYKVVFKDNAESFKETLGKSCKNGTCVTFYPDLERFNLKEIDEIHISYIYQRILTLANIFTDIKFKFNKKLIKVKNFKDFVKLFNENFEIYENENIKLALVPNPSDDFKHFTYVNGLKIKDGGIHVDEIMKATCDIIREKLSKKFKGLKPGDIKNKLTIIAFIKNFPNPKFNSQTKEKLTNSTKEFNQFAQIDYSFINKILKNSAFIDPIVEIYKIKEEFENRKALKSVEKVKKIKSDKFFKGIGNSKKLLIVEGLSAFGGISKALGNKEIDYFCLKGKPLNTFEVSHQKFASNQELSDLYKIIINNNYQQIIFTSDLDLDGHHIVALLATFIEKYLPEYKDKIYRFNTPVKAIMKDNKPLKWVYDLSDKLEHKNSEHVKYFKGLGSWQSEWLDYIIGKDGLNNMIMKLNYDSSEIISEFMSSNESDTRKDYIRNHKFSIASL